MCLTGRTTFPPGTEKNGIVFLGETVDSACRVHGVMVLFGRHKKTGGILIIVIKLVNETVEIVGQETGKSRGNWI